MASKAKLLKCTESVLTQVGVLIAFGIQGLNEQMDNIFLLNQVSSPKVLRRHAVNKGHQVLTDFWGVTKEQSFEY